MAEVNVYRFLLGRLLDEVCVVVRYVKYLLPNPSRISILQRFTAHNNLAVLDILLVEVSKLT